MSLKQQSACPICGYPLKASDKICSNCGEALDVAIPASSVSDDEETYTESLQRKKKTEVSRGKKAPKSIFQEPWKLAAIIEGIAIVVLAVTLYIQNYTGQRNNESQASEEANAGAMQRLESEKEYVDSHPEDTEALLRFANSLHDSKSIDQAIVYYQKYLTQVPDNVDARIDLGVCYFEKQQFPAAIGEIEKALAIQPDHLKGNFNLGVVNFAAGNHEQASKWFNRTIALDPNSVVGQEARRILDEMIQQRQDK